MRLHTAIATASDLLDAAGILPGGSHYPPQSQPSPRSGQWLLRSFERLPATNFQQLLIRAALYLIAPKLNESTYDTAGVDPLATEVLDFFDPRSLAAFRLESGGDAVDHCMVLGGGVEPFAGWYALRLDVEIKLKRQAGDP